MEGELILYVSEFVFEGVSVLEIVSVVQDMWFDIVVFDIIDAFYRIVVVREIVDGEDFVMDCM